MPQLTGNEQLVTLKGTSGPVTTGAIAALASGGGPATVGIADVTGLQSALDAKATTASVTAVSEALDDKADAADLAGKADTSGLSVISCLGHNIPPRSMYATQTQDPAGRVAEHSRRVTEVVRRRSDDGRSDQRCVIGV